MNRRRKWLRIVPSALLVLGFFLTQGRTALASSGTLLNTFQLDGDAQYFAGTQVGGDWDQLNQSRLVNSSFYTKPSSFPSTTTSTAQNTASDFNVDAPPESPASYFTGGKSKDIYDVSQWASGATSAQPKDEITDAYSSAYNVTEADGQHQLLYFGADRFSNSGNSTMGFWFFKSAVSWNSSTNSFTGTHSTGDILVVADFPGTSSSSATAVNDVAAYQWNPACTKAGLKLPSGATCFDANLQILEQNATATSSDCQSISSSATPDLCVTVNRSATASPWLYTPASSVGQPQQFPPGAFEEGGLDITKFFGNGVCFQTFESETRSSNSATATLSDFTMGSFNTCDAKISIDSGAVNEVGNPHTFNITAYQNTGTGFTTVGAGQTVSASIVSGPAGASFVPAGTANGACPATPNTGPVTATTNSSGVAQVTVISCKPGIVNVQASATINVGGQPFTRTTGDGKSGDSPNGQKLFVDAKIGLSPLNATNSVGAVHHIVVAVQQDDGIAANGSYSGTLGTIAGDTCTGPCAASGAPVNLSLTNANGATAQFSDSSGNPVSTGTPAGSATSCTTGSAGTCDIYLVSNSAGNVTISATTQLTVATIPLSRATVAITLPTSCVSGASVGSDGTSASCDGHGDSTNALKTYAAGSITLTKTIDLGFVTQLPSQVCFTLQRTDSNNLIVAGQTVNNTTGSKICATPTVTKQASLTSYGSAGFGSPSPFNWTGLATGTYQVTENALSAPYSTISPNPITGVSVNATGTGSAKDVNLCSNGTNASPCNPFNNPLALGALQLQKTVNGATYNLSPQFSFKLYYCGGDTTCNGVTAATTTASKDAAISAGLAGNSIVLQGTYQVPCGSQAPPCANPIVTVSSLLEGTYVVQEATPPAGFAIDGGQDSVVTVVAGNTANPPTVTIDNKQLYQLHVYVCDMQGNLHSNANTSVTLSGPSNLGTSNGTQTTVGSVPGTEPQGTNLCDSGITANYNNLLPTTAQPGNTPYTATVTITP